MRDHTCFRSDAVVGSGGCPLANTRRNFPKTFGFPPSRHRPRCIAAARLEPHHGPVLTDYCGATRRLDPAAGLALPDRRYGWQLKHDGCYVRISLDGHGRIASVLSRAGRRVATDLLGILAGPPDSVLHGELEAHTEAGIRAATARGYALCHLFDVTRLAGRDLTAAPYVERHGLLYTAQSVLEGDDLARVRSWQTDATGRAHASSGRFVAPTPRDLRRLPVTPLVRGHAAARELWRRAVELGGGEGLVACRLDAPARARNAKSKIKLTDTLDAVVLDACATAMTVEARIATDSARGPRHRVVRFAMPGTAPIKTTIEVRLDGWYATGLPRFPRLVRSRDDLSCGGATLHQ